MRRIDGVLGNVSDDPEFADGLARHEQAGTAERVVIDLADRRKSRLRVETDAGTDLGIVLGETTLRAGDVLIDQSELFVVVAFESREALVVDLPSPTADVLDEAVTFGHRIGNQHWDLVVRNGAVYVPLEADRHIVENVIDCTLPDGATIRYEEVDASLFLDRSDDAPKYRPSDHEHSHGGDHDHPHEHTHSHDHIRPQDHAHEEIDDDYRLDG